MRQLRDPALLEDDGRVFLFYAVAGEMGIALAELELEFRDRPPSKRAEVMTCPP